MSHDRRPKINRVTAQKVSATLRAVGYRLKSSSGSTFKPEQVLVCGTGAGMVWLVFDQVDQHRLRDVVHAAGWTYQDRHELAWAQEQGLHNVLVQTCPHSEVQTVAGTDICQGCGCAVSFW